MFGELEDRKEYEESSPALLTGIEATEAQRSAARHEKILFIILCFPLLTDAISNIYKDITLSGISQLGGLSNTQKKTLDCGKGPLCSGASQFAAVHAAARAIHFWVNCFQDDTLGATYNKLYISSLGIFRVGILATLKTPKVLTINNLRVARNRAKIGLRSCKSVNYCERTSHHQMPGRSWRAGKPGVDGKPAAPDRPLGGWG